MSLTAAASGFVVFLLSVQVIQAQNGWKVNYTPTQICALKGSTVKMKCTYRYPYRINDRVTTVEETFWFTQMNGDVPMDLRTDLRYAGRLQYRCSNKVCTLTITDLRESDSAEYKFRVITNQPDGSFLGSPGVTLSVTGLNVQVGRHFHYASPELLCHSSCSLRDHPFYVWYKNGKYILRKQSYSVDFDSADSYSCAIKGHEDFRSPSVYAPKFPSVSVSPSVEIVESRSVTLTCSSDANPAAKYTWYKENGYPNFNPLSKESQFVFSSIQSSDSGEYYCAAENELGRRTSSKYIVNVKYAPKTSSVTASPSGKIMEGSSVILTCSSDANPTATNTWYKKNQSQPQGLQGIYHFNSISPEDSGIYYCKSENQYGQLCSTSLSIDVHYAPKLPSVSASPSAEIVEGSSLTLTCSSDAYPAAKFTWYKENQTLIQGPEDIYYFTSVSVEDSGIYHCKSENEYGQINSTSVSIDVQYAPKLPSVSVSPSAEIVKGSSVNLTCSSDANPAATYTWYKENEDSPKASGQIFTVTDIRPEHSGNYYCEAQNTRGRHNSTLHLIVVAGSLKSAAGSVTAIFLALIFLCAFLLIRRKRSSKQTIAPGERPDNAAQLNMSSVCNNPSAAAQRTPAESDGLCYASVSFSKHQEDPLYSNVRTAQPNRHKNEEEEDEDGVEYSVVNFKSASASAELRRQEAVEEDSSSLYSTVTKKPRL